MQKLQIESYMRMREGARVLEKDSCGEKVLLLSDGTILKLFRLKHLFSSAVLYPYAKRFADNIANLQRLHVACPSLINTYKIPSIKRDAVHYHPLPGVTLRQLRRQNDECPENLFDQLGRFLAHLHEKGIFFRSIHLGNIVLTPEGGLGLIDIADLKCQTKPLGPYKSKRNFKHMMRDVDDRAWIESKVHGDLFNAYYQERARQPT
ncbi:toluene tolerance protein [Stutzerimonas stutzeri]|uniref:toluene tolerance protein n=1 Tax=Stutzerimonas stutzeri TaxID=316 RepID=UPI001786289D|nr:toluene tolerance protein [Stutzerimonas stutzeri]MBD9408771.1 toluene tolerance protein [Stutzerimonas stutzeri]